METWRFVAAVLMSLTLGLIGVALASNFRGVTEWHVRRSMAAASVLRRVPPWRWLKEAQYDERLTLFVRLERVLGVMFVAAGVMSLALLVYGILSGEPMPSTR